MSDLTTIGPGKVAWLTVLASAAGDVSAQDRSDAARGYEVEAVYTADVWRNAHGGLRTGNAYLDNIDLALGIDGEHAWGLRGVSAYAHVLYNNKARFSERYVGDDMTVSNIDAPEAVRLYEAWLQWAFDTPQPVSLRFGLYDLNSEFDTSDTRSLFIHSTHGVGHELAQTGQNGPSIFPVTSLGLRAAWEPAQNWRVLAVVLDGVPGDPDRTGTHIHLSGEEGVLGVAELQWSSGRIGKLSLGHWQYTADFADIRSTEAEPLPGRNDNLGTYAALEVALGDIELPGGPNTFVFARYGVANGRINECDEFFSFGLRHRGIFALRPDDELGLAFSRANASSAARGASLATGELHDGYEAALELTYRAAVTEWLTIQPDVQYILNPGMEPSLQNSLAFGLRFELSPAVFQ